ncbi:MAG TPA: GIY-YIG nuclease family protein [Caulobacteraceae bacterium]|nr:GIY-YIG nuclease family protein [Caulobacteraceae bacterium]
MSFYVYMLASKRNGTLYIGSTDDLSRRMIEHKEHTLSGFTTKYDVGDLVWFEEHETRDSAFTRERRMKKWRRAWKIELIERFNPGWRDLTPQVNAGI